MRDADLAAIESLCQRGMKQAAETHGRHGCYLIRTSDGNFTFALTDDPEDAQEVYAHIQPGAVHPIGPCRYWLRQDGTVDHSYFCPQGD